MRITRKIRSYDLAFQAEAVALVQRSNRTFTELSQSLGVPKDTLRNWYKRAMAKKGKKPAAAKAGVEAVAETAEEKVARLELENAALKRRVASLEEDREILKKFAAFSTRENT